MYTAKSYKYQFTECQSWLLMITYYACSWLKWMQKVT